MTTSITPPARLGSTLLDLREYLTSTGAPPFVGRSVESDSYHVWYVDPRDPSTRYRSITNILDETESTPWKAPWYAKMAARFAIQHWADLADMLAAGLNDEALRWVRDNAERDRSTAADCGTWLHDVLEALLLDRPIPDPPTDLIGRHLDDEPIDQERLDRWADGLLAWIEDFRPTPLMAEATVASPAEGVAGRLDFGGDFAHYGALAVDLKSGRTIAEKVYCQLWAYTRLVTQVWLPDGRRLALPRFTGAAVLRLRPSMHRGYKFMPVPEAALAAGGQEFMHRWHALRKRTALREDHPFMRTAAYPPQWRPDGSWTPPRTIPMVEDVDGTQFPRGLLTAAGLLWLEDLTHFRAEDLLSVPERKTKRDPAPAKGIKGLGAKKLDAVRAALALYGLALAGETLPAESEVA
jgi:hypothetical protein